MATARVDQILHHFVLPVDRDGLAAAQFRQMDVVTLAAEAEVQPLCGSPSRFNRSPTPMLDHQIDGALLQHAGPHPFDHVFPAAIFDDDRIDALQMQQVTQQ